MKVVGFTIVRNAVVYDYPVVESISSLLPLVDEVIVAVGNSTDATRDLVASIGDPKIRILDTVWDDTLRTGGRVLAQQTNLAMQHCGPADWYVYLQADEVLHEADTACIQARMRKYLSQEAVEGLSFRYHHFRADYHIRDPLPYRRQIRIIRPGLGIHSHGDACGFRLRGRKLKSAPTGAWIYHYGYVRPPRHLSAKMNYFTSLYDGRQVNPGQVKDGHVTQRRGERETRHPHETQATLTGKQSSINNCRNSKVAIQLPRDGSQITQDSYLSNATASTLPGDTLAVYGRQSAGASVEAVPDFRWDLSTCELFAGAHPKVMHGRIANKDWHTPPTNLQPRWRNPKYYQGLAYKNTRTLRRWIRSARNLVSKAA